MNREEWLGFLRGEEENADDLGWDFSHIEGRYEESPLPWDYGDVIRQYLAPGMKLLDTDTGGGEFLLGLGHPPRDTFATEGYPPNVEFCRRALCPLGIGFAPCGGGEPLPFEDGTFDVLLNRHGDLRPEEAFRVLKEGGLFITQQVGADNDRELVGLLMGDLPLPYPDQRLAVARQAFLKAGFSVLRGEEHYGTLRFFDLGALVWFAKKVEWEFPGFSVDSCQSRLLQARIRLEETGVLEGRTHRFLLVAQKPHRGLISHYDGLLRSGNDPVADPEPLREYMDRWDGNTFLAKMELSQRDSVLEIGVGTGRLALRTAPLCGRFTGIDLAPLTAEKAREYLAEFSGARVLCGDFLTYPFEETFDLIYSSLTLLHVSCKEAAVRKIVSLLRPGGRVLLSLDRSRETVLDAGYGRLPVWPDEPEEILSLLERYGFRKTERFELEYATAVYAVK